MSPLTDPNWKRSRNDEIHDHVARGVPVYKIVRAMCLSLEIVNSVIEAKRKKDQRIKDRARGNALIERTRKDVR